MAKRELSTGRVEEIVESDAADLSVEESHRILVDRLAELIQLAESMRERVRGAARYDLDKTLSSLQRAAKHLDNCGNALPESQRIIEQISEHDAALMEWAPTVNIKGATCVEDIYGVMIRRGMGRYRGSIVHEVMSKLDIPEQTAADFAFAVVKITARRFDPRLHGHDFVSWMENIVLTCFDTLNDSGRSIAFDKIRIVKLIIIVENIIAKNTASTTAPIPLATKS